jgi:hypothetical protein
VNIRPSITRRFHCDAASMLCRCAAHSEDAALGARSAVEHVYQTAKRPTAVTYLINNKNKYIPITYSNRMNNKAFQMLIAHHPVNLIGAHLRHKGIAT